MHTPTHLVIIGATKPNEVDQQPSTTGKSEYTDPGT